ncbi:MAG: class I SAM-dependent methyltransferase [Candidatus Methanofastidiosia archaeon]
MRKFTTPENTKKFYNGIGHKIYQPFMKLAGYQKVLPAAMNQLLSHVELKDGDKILDVGVGTGIVTINLLKECKKDVRVVGVDISEKQLEIAERNLKKENLEDKIELRAADASKLPFDDNSFDFVLSTGMIEHLCMHGDLKRVKPVVREMVRVLKPRRKLFILTVSDRFWGKVTAFMWQMGYYSEDDVGDMMENAGLKDVEILSFDVKGLRFPKSAGITAIGTKNESY